MAPATARSRPGRKAAPAKRSAKPAVAVAAKVRRSLAEDVAYFRAARFRDAAPGDCREEDRCAAEAEIKAALRKLRKR